MKRKLLAVLISIALIATVMVPVLGTLASEVETSPAPESSPAAEEEKQTEVDNSKIKQTEVCEGFEEKQTKVDSEEQMQTGEKQDSATVEPQASEQTDTPSITEVSADPTATLTPETTNEPEQTEEVPTDVPAETEIPTAEPTNEPTEEPTPEPSVEPSTEPTEVPELKAGISANQRSAFSGEGISATVHVEGGVAPYNVKVTVSRDGTVLCDNTYVMELSGDLNAAAIADGFGTHTIAAVITDADGNSMSMAVSIPVAVKEAETRAEWEATIRGAELIGDWREDILAIARTQLGYHESSRNFIVREDGSVQGWTRYGALSGMPYEEWCAMFVTFCMKYAEIPEADYPHFSGCERWLNALDALGAFESRQSGYEPQPGDLIFFNWDEESDADHIGIVESVRDGWVNTIEGNSGRQVRRQSYALNDTQIMGYGNTTKMMDRAGALAEPTPAPTPVPIENVEGRLAAINADGVNLREMPTTESIVLAVLNQDTRVTVVNAELYDGEIWYRVEREGVQGYVRSDLLTIEEAKANEEQEARDMNGVKPSGDSWQAGQEGVSFGFDVDGAERYL